MGMYDTLLALVCAVPLMLVGLAGVVVPGLPGAPLIWLGMLIYGLIAGFDNLSLWFYVCQANPCRLYLRGRYIGDCLGSKALGRIKSRGLGGYTRLFDRIRDWALGALDRAARRSDCRRTDTRSRVLSRRACRDWEFLGFSRGNRIENHHCRCNDRLVFCAHRLR